MVKLREQFPVELDKIYRLEVTSLDSIPTLRVKVEEYKESSDEEIDHVVRRFLNGFKGQHSQDKGMAILTPGTYLVDIVDNLDWTAGDLAMPIAATGIPIAAHGNAWQQTAPGRCVST